MEVWRCSDPARYPAMVPLLAACRYPAIQYLYSINCARRPKPDMASEIRSWDLSVRKLTTSLQERRS